MVNEMITEIQVLPDGATIDEENWHNTRHWVLTVKWCGPRTENGQGGYGVTDNFAWLSRAHNWSLPRPYQRHQYRWNTIEEALAAARDVVNDYSTNGRTYAQWAKNGGIRTSVNEK